MDKEDSMKTKPPIIIVGHYGSGKTEFVVNYARNLKRKGEDVTIADMDIVNPYFRAREFQEQLRNEGIEVISSNFERDPHVDTPAMAASIKMCFQPSSLQNLMDVGGDPSGANVLALYAHNLKNRDYHMWIVVNANRPKTSTTEGVQFYINQIEQMSKLKINGIINATHMLRETGIEDVLKGDRLVREISNTNGIPVKYTVFQKELESDINSLDLAGELFPINLGVMPDWM